MYKVAVLFLQYDTEKYPNAFFYLEKFLARITNSTFRKIILDNKYGYKNVGINYGDITYLNGDNTCWEFSGWDTGIEYLNRLEIDYDAILFCNDSFLNPAFGSVMHIINDAVIENCIKEKAMAGAGRGGQKLGLTLCGKDVSTWNGSHCFLIERSVVEGLGRITSLDRDFIDQCINPEPSFPYFRHDAPMSCALKRGTIHWLQEYWHSKFKIEDNWELFRMKSLAYFNELMLTQRARDFKVMRIE